MQSNSQAISLFGVPLRLLLAASIGNAVAHFGTSTMPLQVGALMDGVALSPVDAGTYSFLQVGTFALSMMLIAPVIDRFSSVMLAFFGIAMVVGGSALIFILPWSLLSYVLSILMGAGYGLIFAATITTVSVARDPDRLYAVSNGGAVILVVGLVGLLPVAASWWGKLGVFLGIALCCLMVAPMLGALKGKAGAKSADGERALEVLTRPGALPLLFLWISFSLGTGAIWVFAERVGKHLELDPQTIGVILSVSIAAGVAGSAAAAFAGGRYARKWLIAGGLVGSGLSCMMISYALNIFIYATGIMLYWAAYMFLYSILLGTAAMLDPKGRIGTLGGGGERMAYAAGAWIGGVVFNVAGLSTIGWLGLVGCTVSLVFFLPRILPHLPHSLPQAQGQLDRGS